MADPQGTDSLIPEVDTGEQIRRIVRAARENRFRLILFAAIGMILGAGVATMVPDLYESRTLLLLREHQLLDDSRLLRAIEDQPLAVKEETLEKEIASYEWIFDVLRKVEWVEFAKVRNDPAKVWDLVAKIRDPAHLEVNVETDPAGELMVELVFRWFDPKAAHDFVLQMRRSWVDRRVQESKAWNAQQLQEAQDILHKRQRDYERALQAREDFLSENKLSFIDEKGSDADLKNTLVVDRSRLQSEIREKETQIRALEEQLGLTDPVIINPIRERNPKYDQAVQVLQSEQSLLTSLQLRYTDSHPQIKQQKKKVEEAEAAFEQVKNSEFLDQTQTQEQNPVWLELRKQIDVLSPELKGARERLADLDNQLDEVNQRLADQPSLRSQLDKLENEFQVAQEALNEVLVAIAPVRDRFEKQEQTSALVFATAEDQLQARGAFAILEPPVVPEEPVGLPKPVFVLIGLLVGLAFGLAVALLAEMTRSTYDDPAEVGKALKLPVLAVIGNISTESERRRVRNRELTRMTGSILIVAALGVFVYIVTAAPDLLPPRFQAAIEELRSNFQ